MSIISALRTYLATYSGLQSGALLLTDQVGVTPVQYGVIPLPGEKIIERYVNGGSLRECPFAFETVKSTADELERIESIGFQEGLSDWFELQTASGTLPTLGSGKTAIAIEATSWGYLFEQGDSDTGIYQIVCKLTYEQAP